jgi:glycosyltransferase involved in cell wall biosynthesis
VTLYSPPETSSPPKAAPRRILYVDHTAKLGGGEIALLHLTQYLDRTRFEPVVVLSSDGPLREKLREAGVEVHVLAISASVLETRKDSLGLSTLLRLRDAARVGGYTLALARFIRAQRIALVHTNSLKADILGGVAARIARVPLLWHIRDRIDADYLPVPVVWLFRRLCRWVPNYVIANSESTLETLSLPKPEHSTAVYSGIDIASRIRVVHDGVKRLPNPIPLVYEGLYSSGLAAAGRSKAFAPKIGLVGRISPWKGQHIFLQAAARVHTRFPGARFQIIGSALFNEEDYEAQIRALTQTLALEEFVEFLGFREDVPQLVAELDVLVHASTSAEPFGQVIVEGMVAGKPVVATDGGGAKEIVVNGETGFLVPMGDAEAMAEAVLFLLDNPEAASEMGRLGYQRACELFSIDRTARKIEAVYDQILPPRS